MYSAPSSPLRKMSCVHYCCLAIVQSGASASTSKTSARAKRAFLHALTCHPRTWQPSEPARSQGPPQLTPLRTSTSQGPLHVNCTTSKDHTTSPPNNLPQQSNTPIPKSSASKVCRRTFAPGAPQDRIPGKTPSRTFLATRFSTHRIRGVASDVSRHPAGAAPLPRTLCQELN